MTTTELVLQLLIVTLNHAQELGALITTARTENRPISDAELDGLRAKYEVNKQALLDEIARQRTAP